MLIHHNSRKDEGIAGSYRSIPGFEPCCLRRSSGIWHVSGGVRRCCHGVLFGCPVLPGEPLWGHLRLLAAYLLVIARLELVKQSALLYC